VDSSEYSSDIRLDTLSLSSRQEHTQNVANTFADARASGHHAASNDVKHGDCLSFGDGLCESDAKISDVTSARPTRTSDYKRVIEEIALSTS